MVDTIKFSEMTPGGDLANNDQTPGLKAGDNVLFNNPWTFLPSGSTASRPAPSATTNYRLRFNTTDQLYEYYDAVLGAWTQLQESLFTAGPFVTYKADAGLVGAFNLGTLTSGILKQTVSAGISTPAIAINGTDYYGPGFTGYYAAPAGIKDTNGNIVVRFGLLAAAVNYLAITNSSTGINTRLGAEGSDADIGISYTAKGDGIHTFFSTYTIPIAFLSSVGFQHRANFEFANTANTQTITFPDGDFTVASVAGTVASATGTANQVLINGTTGVAQTGALTFTLPQSIGALSPVQFNSVQYNSINSIVSANGLLNISVVGVAAAVNYLISTNSATGNNIALSAGGTDANIGILINAKGSGINAIGSASVTPIKITSGTAQQHSAFLQFANAATSQTITFPDGNFTVASTAGTVASATGTADQILINGTTGVAQTGALTFTLPQSIGALSPVQFNSVQYNSINSIVAANGLLNISVVGVASAVNYLISTNSATGNNIALSAGGTDSDIGILLNAKGSGINAIGSASVTPIKITSGTAQQHSTFLQFANAATSQTITFPDTSFTVAGTSLALGGTNAALTASNGGIVYSTASAMAILAGTATAGQIIRSGASTTPSWSTTTYPATNAINTIMYASAANVLDVITPTNLGVLVYSAGGVPSSSTTLPSGLAATNMNLTTPTLGVAAATSINFGGSALSTYVQSTSFTPTFTFATPGNLSVSYATQSGTYTRIGNLVFITYTIVFTPTHTTASGNAQFGGLPITVNASGNYRFVVSISETTTWPTSTTYIYGAAVNSQTYLTLNAIGSGATAANFTTTNFPTATQKTIVFSGFYSA